MGQRTNLTLFGDSALFHTLDSIATTATIEHARCLFGLTKPDTFHILYAVEPIVHHADANVMDLEPCPFGALGFWHVHIPKLIRINGQVSDDGLPPESHCYLSRPDMETALTPDAPELQFVAVGHGIWCFWTRQQIAARQKLVILPALPNQLQRPQKTP